ncbi:PREDICTED: uncharacterized mitochondrial protein AtMg00810-like [Brassica oleracea var. oleracea]|uniref:uncharacterized mitochondrial protein AtMg00810-like n=1 Tax=Brassica oleracea var. oleracea TaxID=109376 RepID=UPI0006A74749|nr:PREDICTED: uncharacterized mitochondrial protein AtMg00810-like [Brassica oleracea var. oleracea]
MSTKFEISDLGKLTYYLGSEVNQHEGGISLSQDRYAVKILEEAGMNACNLTHIPMDVNVKFSKSSQEKGINEHEYRRSIGCLRSKKKEIIGFSDSSHNVDEDVGRSTHDHVFYLDESPITWCSQKQEIVALSSCEAEFMAATEAANKQCGFKSCLVKLLEVEHIPGIEQRADILMKSLGKLKFKEMRSLIGVQNVCEDEFKLKVENVGISLE